jgi:hypothetical protein
MHRILDRRPARPVNFASNRLPTTYSVPVPRLRYRLLVLAALLAVFPFFLRRRPRVERRITILAPPEAIFPFLEDLRHWPLWTAWDERETHFYAYSEDPRGAGAEQRWRTARMDGVLRVVKSETDERLDYELEMRDGAYRMFGRIELHADGACTRVIWKTVWDLAENPYGRYCDLFLRWVIGRDFAAGLANLKALVESTPASPLPHA